MEVTGESVKVNLTFSKLELRNEGMRSTVIKGVEHEGSVF